MATTITSSYAGTAILVGEWDGLRQSLRRLQEAQVTGIAPDPLIRPAQERARAIGFMALLLLGAALAHLLFTLVVSAAGVVLKSSDHAERRAADEQVEIAMIEVPPAPEPELPPVAAAEPEIAVAPAPETRPEPEPARKPAPEPRKIAPEPEPAPQPPRRVVGLSLESTVEGGSGGGYAVGETRAGKTEQIARDPRSLGRATRPEPTPAPAARPAGPPPSKNRRSTRIAAPGVEIVKPKRTQRVEPVYPEILRARGIADNVVVQVAIDASGRVTGVEIIAPSKYEELNQAARTAAWQESFRPATRNGEPIEFSLSFTYRFRLSD